MPNVTPYQPNTLAYLGQIESVLDLPGDIAECGVYKGYNTFHYANYLKSMGSQKEILGFDSFSGLPKDSIEPADLTRFDDTDLSLVRELLEPFDRVHLVPGFFVDTFKEFSSRKFSCVILDCDIYESYKTCLDFFYSRMSPGGVIVLDEYYSKKYPLARKAVDEFCVDKPLKPEMFKLEANGWQRWRIKI
jgi:hypothetical protein